jgi:PPOX class probable F420-dependent enzyme
MPDAAISPPATGLPAEALEFLRTPGRYAVVATIDPDGRPHQVVVWYRLVDDAVVLNSRVGRRWPTNLARDARISIVVSDGHDWVSVLGTVEIVDDQAVAQADIAAMARAYETRDEAAESIAAFRGQRRVSFRVTPERVHVEIGE